MRHTRTLIMLALAGALAGTSCKKGTSTVTPGTDSKLITFKEFEGVDPTQPNSGSVFLERNFVYDQNKLIRIDTKKRGVADGYRTIIYTGDLPLREIFYDKDNNIRVGYTFNYEAGSTRVSSIDIDYRDVTPFVQGRFVYHYNSQNKVDSVASYTNGRFIEYMLYEYSSAGGEEKVVETLVQRSDSDPNFKLKHAVIEYVYDDKKSPGIWPVFMWNQLHDELLDLHAPISTHNIKSYTYKSLNLTQSDPANNVNVYDITYPTFNAAIFYNTKGYVTHYTENRLNANNPVAYTYLYDSN